VVVWTEEISRGLAHSAMDAFPTFADAAAEIIDNPIDFRYGRKLSISVVVDKARDLMVFEDYGGEGMDAEGIADWLKWGTGRARRKGDISLYRQGGKAACGYLADSLVLYAKRAGSEEIWKLEDADWRGRTDARDWGEPRPVRDVSRLPATLRRCPKDEGIVRIELRRLRPNYVNLEALKWRLSSTYRWLILSGDVTISINGEKIPPLELPLSTAFPKRQIDLRTASGGRIRGWVGRLDRDALVIPKGKFHVRAGLRCYYSRRLVTDGEAFGHNLEGKGLLASLIGEVELNSVKPIPNKTDFQRSSPEWAEGEKALFDFLAPIVAQLRQAGEKKPISREERKRLTKVCDEVGEALRRLRADVVASGMGDGQLGKDGTEQSVVGPGGRRRARKGAAPSRPPAPGTGSRGPVRKRTSPPDDAVGRLLRQLSKVAGGSTKPPAVLDTLDSSVRSQWRRENGSAKIVVNVKYPLYEEFGGSEPYLAETLVMQLAQPVQEGEVKTLDDYLAEVNNMLRAWAEVRA
jgi:hypothetical protein